MDSKLIDFHSYTPVNDLWPRLVEKIGLDKARRAIAQAVDLQGMHGQPDTLAVLFFETCGLALISSDSLYRQTGIPIPSSRMVLLASIREGTLQLLHHL